MDIWIESLPRGNVKGGNGGKKEEAARKWGGKGWFMWGHEIQELFLKTSFLHFVAASIRVRECGGETIGVGSVVTVGKKLRSRQLAHAFRTAPSRVHDKPVSGYVKGNKSQKLKVKSRKRISGRESGIRNCGWAENG